MSSFRNTIPHSCASKSYFSQLLTAWSCTSWHGRLSTAQILGSTTLVHTTPGLLDAAGGRLYQDQLSVSQALQSGLHGPTACGQGGQSGWGAYGLEA